LAKIHKIEVTEKEVEKVIHAFRFNNNNTVNNISQITGISAGKVNYIIDCYLKEKIKIVNEK